MIVLLHGFTGDRTTWDEVIEHWQLEQPPWTLDLPGHGGAVEVADGWEGNLEALRQRLGAEPAATTIVGYSLGARVALGLVAADAASRAVLISVNAGIPEEERVARRQSDRRWVDLLRGVGEQGGRGGGDGEGEIQAFVSQWQAQPLFASQRQVSAERRARRDEVRRRQRPEALARSLENMGLAEMPDYRPLIPALASRLTLVVGAQDAKFCALADDLVAQAPALSLHRVPDAGHDVPLEQPRALAVLLGELLRR
ncbi:MAG: alpha/beta fold hydrolase [Kofleriaceae bacterium]